MIPTYQDIMLPLLKILNDDQLHSLNEVHDELAEHFKLTDEELRELLPSGQQPVFRNRVGWAR
jgi:restriction system protein